MSAETTNLHIRIDKETKEQADEILTELGMNLSTAVNVFIKQLIRERSIPFNIALDVPAQYNLPYIRQCLAEAEVQASDPDTKLITEDALRRALS